MTCCCCSHFVVQ